jgi:DNA processing protein
MNSISATAVALTALMSLRGVGRRKALGILSAPVAAAYKGDHRRVLLPLAVAQGIDGSGFLEAWSHSEALLEKSAEAGIEAFSIYDEDYPARLRDIPDPPPVLFVKGDLAGLSTSQAVAIVGTREPTSYGKKVAKRAGEVAASAGFAVVSGLAHGCDTFGHEGCLEVSGVGVAVMAHGLDRVYPAANRGLANRLLEHAGCWISEYPMGATPSRSAFAERDRIQSGLSDGVLVIETDVQGGTMHTVRFARAQKRQIGCIAHPIEFLGEEKTRGNQKLIEDHWAVAVADGPALSLFFDKIRSKVKSETTANPLEKSQAQQAWAF